MESRKISKRARNLILQFHIMRKAKMANGSYNPLKAVFSYKFLMAVFNAHGFLFGFVMLCINIEMAVYEAIKASRFGIIIRIINGDYSDMSRVVLSMSRFREDIKQVNIDNGSRR